MTNGTQLFTMSCNLPAIERMSDAISSRETPDSSAREVSEGDFDMLRSGVTPASGEPKGLTRRIGVSGEMDFLVPDGGEPGVPCRSCS